MLAPSVMKTHIQKLCEEDKMERRECVQGQWL